MTNALRNLLVGLGLALSLSGTAAADTQVHLVHGGKRCTFTSTSTPAVKLITEGPDAGDLLIESTEAAPFSGDGCPGDDSGGAVTVSPVTAPATANANVPFIVQFRTTGNPDYCSPEGSVIPENSTVANWGPVSSSTQLCTGAACASVTRSITASGAGEHRFGVKCYKAGQQPVSSSLATVRVIADCPAPQVATRVGGTTVLHSNFGERWGDAKFYDNVFGYSPATSTANPFPGPNIGSQVNLGLSPGEYFAMEFTVPADTRPTFKYSLTTFETRWRPAVGAGATPIGLAISPCPGVFNDPQMAPTCRANLQPQGDTMQLSVNTAFTSTCPLVPGKTYYMNFVFANVNTPGTPNCNGSCKFSIRTLRDASRPAE
ncbi:hypothetical protein [Tahibacter amnicola]|uniref:Uncharacterized protein n=1 Tax=Tahibacter amnicola TaxID=2976241 RepID=A0ABY6BKI3_9GAMM|nr:hypothetical protein [Tahibacter amnicola]UXI70126.1 hypothetical protein N4264_10995 [Tahibacter amnicola]